MPQTAKRAATRSPAKGSAQSAAQSAAKVRTFAPPPAAASAGSAGAHPLERCPGCAYTPWPECAACGAPTVYALEVAGVTSAGATVRHALTLCAACHALLLRLRDPRAEPLRYLPLTPAKQAKRHAAKQAKRQPARRSSRAQGGAA